MNFALKNKKIVLLIFLCVTIFFGYNLKNILFNHDVESFYDKKDESYKFDKEFFSHFENQEFKDQFILGVENKKSLDYNFLTKIDSLTKFLKKQALIKNAHSISNQKLILFTGLIDIPYTIFHPKDSISFKKDKIRLDNYPDIKKQFLSKDLKSTLIYIDLKNKNYSIDNLKALKTAILLASKEFDLKNLFFFNSELMDETIIEKLKKESNILTTITMVIIIFILLFFYRSIKGVIIPLSIISIAVVWILGLISFCNVPLNVLTIAIPVIVAVISLSDVIHIINRYSEEKGDDGAYKIKTTQKDIFKAIILTTITTSFGFLSLIPSQIKVFVEFGLFTAIGVLFAFIIAIFLLPILIVNSNLKPTITLTNLVPNKLYKKQTILVFILIAIFSITGILLIKKDSYIYEDINAQDETSFAMKNMSENFYGVRELILAIKVTATNESVLSYKIAQEINALQLKADTLFKTTNPFSLITFLKQTNRAMNGGNISYYVFPENEKSYNKVLKKLQKYTSKDKLKIISKNNSLTYIHSNIKDIGSYEVKKKNKKLLDYASKNLTDINVTISGDSHIQDQINFNVTSAMFYSLLFIIVLIFLIISILFKSINIGLISLVPNLLPIFIILGIVGWFNVGMSISISVVFTVVFGIAVDDTIHFLSRYKIERDKGCIDPVKKTIKTSGSAILLTTLILLAAYLVLIFSDFRANHLSGIFVSIGLTSALLCDLFLLPVLLKIFDSKNN